MNYVELVHENPLPLIIIAVAFLVMLLGGLCIHYGDKVADDFEERIGK